MQRIKILALLLCGLGAAMSHAAAQDVDALYRATVIVTGTGEANRQIGFRLAMEDVIVRVSGDYRLIISGKAASTVANAASLVTKIHYRDRYEGIPVHDEQGTHDRPHDLTVDFDHAKVDAALAAMGSRPWLAPRPRLVVFLGVRNAKGTFVLSGDGDQGFYMRDSFTASSARIAMPIALPSLAAIEAARLKSEALGTIEPAALDALAKTSGGDQALVGTLEWSDAARGWIAEWRLSAAGQTYAWRISGVSFDDAFRNALRGAAQVLSGNGQPDS
jgi:uncharacterized protein